MSDRIHEFNLVSIQERRNISSALKSSTTEVGNIFYSHF